MLSFYAQGVFIMTEYDDGTITTLAPRPMIFSAPVADSIQDRSAIMTFVVEHSGTHPVWVDVEVDGAESPLKSGEGCRVMYLIA